MVACTGAAGVVTMAVAVALAGRAGTGAAGVVAGLTLALTGAWAWPMSLLHRDQTESFHLDEGFLVVAALLLPPLGTLVMFGSGVMAGQLLRRRRLSRVVFNAGQSITAAGLGVAAVRALTPVGPLGISSLLAAVAGAAVFYAVNTAFMAVVLMLSDGLSLRQAVGNGLGFRALVSGASVALGFLAALGASAYSWALLLALAPLAMLHAVLSGSLRARRDRERMDGLFRAALRAHASMSVAAVEDAVTDAAREMLQCRTARVGGDPPGSEELGRVLPGEPDRWLVVADRRGGEPFDTHDAKLLEAIVAVAAGALENARLVDQIKHQALHDSLTGLPNQLLFEDRVDVALAQAGRTGSLVGVLFIDLDDFKKVNDGLGHPAGNQLLVQVARRLELVVRSSDTVARMGGDEFTVLTSAVGTHGDVVLASDRILEAFRQPFLLDGSEVFMTPSIGIAVYPEAGLSAASLLKHADTAMYRAKSRGRNTAELWSPEMGVTAHERLAMETDLRNALERGHLLLHYQPQVDLATGRVVAVEALVRWADPVRGLVGPDSFIPLAEQTGLILGLDEFVLREACAQARRWQERGLPAVRVAVNMSGRNVLLPDLAGRVATTLAAEGFDPAMLEVEVTESVAVSAAGAAQLRELRSVGVRLAIDDFGTGYSMLSRLREFPVDTLKIDRSFLHEVTSAADESPIVAGLIAMAHSLDLEVVAEGVELVPQLDFLARQGCDRAQGFLLARPVPAAEVEAMIAARLVRT